MLRWLFHLLTLLSGLLLTLTLVLWSISGDEIEMVGHNLRTGVAGIVNRLDGVYLVFAPEDRLLFGDEAWGRLAYYVATGGTEEVHDSPEFAGITLASSQNGRTWVARFRFPTLILLTSCLPALWWYRMIKRYRANRRGRKNRCTYCGYDLRGTLSDVCPECGRAAKLPLPRPPLGGPSNGDADTNLDAHSNRA